MEQISYFTAQDVAYVRSSQSPEAKIAIAEKLGFHFRQFPRHSSTFRLAVEIAMLLQKDSREDIRQALARSIAVEAKTPATLATILATDPVDQVAMPVLKHSVRLTDALLLPLIAATRAVPRLNAIAERERLSPPACLALIEKNIQEVCLRVIERHLEMLDGACHLSLVALFGDNVMVMQQTRKEATKRALTLPAVLDIAIQQMLERSVANDQSRVDPSPESVAEEPARLGLEPGLARWKGIMEHFDTGDDAGSEAEYWMLQVERMNREGALQAPIMLLALGMGLLPLFTAGLARHGHVSIHEAALACAGNEQDFRELYQRSHFPSAMYKLCWWTVSSAREMLARGTLPRSAEMKTAMARKLAQADKLKINFARTVGLPVMDALMAETH